MNPPATPITPQTPLSESSRDGALENRFANVERVYNEMARGIGAVRNFREMVSILNTFKNRKDDVDKTMRPSSDMLQKIDSGLYIIVNIIAPLAKLQNIAGLEGVLSYLVSSDIIEFPTIDGVKIELKNDEASLGILEKIRVILAYMIARHNISNVDLNIEKSAMEDEFDGIGGLA